MLLGYYLPLFPVLCKIFVTVKNRHTLKKEISSAKIKGERGGNIMQKNERCLQCGTNLSGMTNPWQRKYCTKLCGERFRYRMKYPEKPHKLWQHEQTVFEGALEMHYTGIGGAEIARHYKIPTGTVYSWIHDYGERNRRFRVLKKQLPVVQNADEWVQYLRENSPINTDDSDNPIVHLVCKTVNGTSNVNILGAIIFERLKVNPLNGEMFAFCNKGRNQITTIVWTGAMFNVTKHVKTHGTFMWMREDLSESIDITLLEFEYLISLEKHKRIIKNP
jgi:transposase-like protein